MDGVCKYWVDKAIECVLYKCEEYDNTKERGRCSVGQRERGKREVKDELESCVW